MLDSPINFSVAQVIAGLENISLDNNINNVDKINDMSNFNDKDKVIKEFSNRIER